MTVTWEWRGAIRNDEINQLHAEGFNHGLSGDDWTDLLSRLSLGCVAVATEEARKAGCEWLHVDLDDHLKSFYFDVCGFSPTNAGLIQLRGL
ncbi:hypothetical protein [Arthrobacter sp. UYCu712]|uniref:hypothetical protein n=1 Tax=Arthrobacter sp. UYCu712 TaxID=3156340 RepID=UPI0033988620